MARYTLDYQYVRTYCPRCNRKSYTYLLDLKKNEVSEFGICSHRNTCGYRHFPIKSEKTHNTKFTGVTYTKQNKIEVSKFDNYTFLDYDKKEFTLINPPKHNCTVIKSLSITEICEMVNDLPKSARKFDSLNLIKGVYPSNGGSSGVNCEKGSDYLFFDVDYNNEIGLNVFLQNLNLRELVKTELEKISVLVFDSFSQKGLGGVVAVKGLGKINNEQKELHLQIAKSVYVKISQIIEESTKIAVKFDGQQGKFRQVRLIPRQLTPLTPSPTPSVFCFSVG